MEKWLPVKGYPKYEASDTGKIRNAKTGRILKQQITDRGYNTITLYEDCKPISKRVHRLVADAFYNGDNELLDVNHKDGNKRNNNIDNLEFCTRKTNINHAFQTGLKTPSRQMSIRVVETGKVYNSINECARDIGSGSSDICKCLQGRQGTCKGFHFQKV